MEVVATTSRCSCVAGIVVWLLVLFLPYNHCQGCCLSHLTLVTILPDSIKTKLIFITFIELMKSAELANLVPEVFHLAMEEVDRLQYAA